MTAHDKVLLTGGTGFTGKYVLQRLLEAGYEVTVFCRNPAKAEAMKADCGEFAISQGALEDPQSLVAALRGQNILVNVASLGFGHAETIIDSAERAGIRRGVFFSTTAIFTTLPADSKAVRQAAEARIRQATFPWTILRPTMITGALGDRNMIRLIKWIDSHKLLPIFGPGTYRLQPVYVDDLAAAVVGVLQSPATANQDYNLSGGTAVNYNSLVALVGELLGRRPWVVHLPINLSLLAVRVARLIPGLPRLSAEQVLRLNEHKDFDHNKAMADFGYRPTPLAVFLARQIEAYHRG